MCWFDFGCETFRLTKSFTLKTKKSSRVKLAPPQPPARKAGRKYVLRLYVAGATARSRLAVLRVRELCAAELKADCDLEVIDIYQQPELARAQQIVATPTLVIEFPRPVRRFIGNLANTAGLIVELKVSPKGKFVL